MGIMFTVCLYHVMYGHTGQPFKPKNSVSKEQLSNMNHMI